MQPEEYRNIEKRIVQQIVGQMASETYSTTAPICPHCDHIHKHEDGTFYDESLTEYQCESCEGMFSVSVYISTSWTCNVIENEDGEG